MLDFCSIALSDKPRVDAVLRACGSQSCEFAFGNLFIWQKVYHTQISFCDDMLIVSYQTPEESSYTCPKGVGDFEKAIREISDHARQNGRRLFLYGCSEEEARQIDQLFPNRFSFEVDEGYYEYIYSAEALADLAGRKYHDKRNHIAAFERNNPDWTFEEINKKNIGQCAEMNERWLRLNEYKDEVQLSAEHNVLNIAMANYDTLGFYGGLIRAGGKVVAFSFGERLNDTTFCTHFEKAYADVKGAYQIINREMARRLRSDFVYINREEDTGSPGLRRAKQSYHPTVWLKKINAIEK